MRPLRCTSVPSVGGQAARWPPARRRGAIGSGSGGDHQVESPRMMTSVPPSMKTHWPVMCWLPAELRNAMRAATSSGPAHPLSGILRKVSIALWPSSLSKSLTSGVCTMPGATAFSVMPQPDQCSEMALRRGAAAAPRRNRQQVSFFSRWRRRLSRTGYGGKPECAAISRSPSGVIIIA